MGYQLYNDIYTGSCVSVVERIKSKSNIYDGVEEYIYIYIYIYICMGNIKENYGSYFIGEPVW